MALAYNCKTPWEMQASAPHTRRTAANWTARGDVTWTRFTAPWSMLADGARCSMGDGGLQRH
jgi:hypothetical protein